MFKKRDWSNWEHVMFTSFAYDLIEVMERRDNISGLREYKRIRVWGGRNTDIVKANNWNKSKEEKTE